ncbi:MAG: hypothetical protein GY854_21960 [Deltaproteobacteria bacterium]|nr:hypothetical protein [Deltaproteobacteria bacterium]
MEHILHHVSMVGLHYVFFDEWGVSTTSKLYEYMQEAISNNYYVVSDYTDIGKRTLPRFSASIRPRARKTG